MNFLKSSVFRLLVSGKRLFFFSSSIYPKKFLFKSMPYYSQWESPEFVDSFLSGKLSAEEDPNWKSSGALNRHEYLHWSWNSCGMACLKSVLEYSLKKNIKLYTLAKLCEQYGGYKVHNRYLKTKEYKKSIEGLFYEPFIVFLKNEFGLQASVKKIFIMHDIITELLKKNFVLVSVDPRIRNPKDTSMQIGGHLVLIVGYDFDKKLFYLHNPSGYWSKSQAFAKISFKDFGKFFAYKGIVIYNPSI